jgi:hypothetical protein
VVGEQEACEFGQNQSGGTIRGVAAVYNRAGYDAEKRWFGCLQEGVARPYRRLVTGVNWSPGIVNPFPQLGAHGASLDTVLTQQRASEYEPIILVLHIEAAKAGGMMALGVARLNDEELLKAAGADLVVKALDEVKVEALLAGRLQRGALDFHFHRLSPRSAEGKKLWRHSTSRR